MAVILHWDRSYCAGWFHQSLAVVTNREYSEKWPVITAKKPEDPAAEEHKTEQGKFDKYFSAEPGSGD